MKICPICGDEMKVGNRNGHYLYCDNCGIYFGLDKDSRDYGNFDGAYFNETAVIDAFNKFHQHKISKPYNRCPICGNEVTINFDYDYDGNRGYYLTCDNCSLYFGLDEYLKDLGYFHGNYSEEKYVIENWNKLFKLYTNDKIHVII